MHVFSTNQKIRKAWTLETKPDKTYDDEFVTMPTAGVSAEVEAPIERSGSATPPLLASSVPRSISDLFSPLASPPQNQSLLPASPNHNSGELFQDFWDHPEAVRNLSLDFRLDNSLEAISFPVEPCD
jgi:hypothetical protein